MQVNIIKLSGWRIPRQFIENWLADLEKQLKKLTKHNLKDQVLTIAFVEKKQMKKLNKDFRSKNKVTDILSFSGLTREDLGELALCGEVVSRQATEHGLHSREELGYLLIHGVLHLLGYDHEKGGREAKKMFALQDRLFEILRKDYF